MSVPGLERPSSMGAVLSQLTKMIVAGEDLFLLLPIECDLNREDRDRFFAQLREHLARQGWHLSPVLVENSDLNLVERLLSMLITQKTAYLLTNLGERSLFLPKNEGGMFELNRVRDTLARKFSAPLLICVSSHEMKRLRRRAPDFFDFYSGIFRIGENASATAPSPPTQEVTRDIEIPSSTGVRPPRLVIEHLKKRLEQPDLPDSDQMEMLQELLQMLYQSDASYSNAEEFQFYCDSLLQKSITNSHKYFRLIALYWKGKFYLSRRNLAKVQQILEECNALIGAEGDSGGLKFETIVAAVLGLSGDLNSELQLWTEFGP